MRLLQERIQAIRKYTGKSMAKIASEANVSPQNLYKWAKGTTPRVRDEFERLRTYPAQFEQNGTAPAAFTQSLFFRELEKILHVQADFIIEINDESIQHFFSVKRDKYIAK